MSDRIMHVISSFDYTQLQIINIKLWFELLLGLTKELTPLLVGLGSRPLELFLLYRFVASSTLNFGGCVFS